MLRTGRNGHPADQFKVAHRVQPLPSDDPERRRPDISVARERLGWQPTTKLEDGLRQSHRLLQGVACRRRRTAA